MDNTKPGHVEFEWTRHGMFVMTYPADRPDPVATYMDAKDVEWLRLFLNHGPDDGKSKRLVVAEA